MTQEALQQKLTEAINDILSTSLDINTLPPDTQSKIQEGITREAEKKSIRIYEYLDQYVFNKLSAIEGRVQNLEQRLTNIDENDPRNTPTDNS